jgi:hypothetical protein
MSKRITQMEAHDAAGYETDYDDFSGCDDGYGNKVEHGDLSVQRMVERGGRSPWHAGRSTDDFSKAEAEGYDKKAIGGMMGIGGGGSLGMAGLMSKLRKKGAGKMSTSSQSGGRVAVAAGSKPHKRAARKEKFRRGLASALLGSRGREGTDRPRRPMLGGLYRANPINYEPFRQYDTEPVVEPEKNPLRERIKAMHEAGVPRERITAAASKRHTSSQALTEELEGAEKEYGGTHSQVGREAAAEARKKRKKK